MVVGIGTIYYDIPDDLHRRLKIEAATRGITLKALLIDALEKVLDASGDGADGGATGGRPR